ncbi:zf-HC2 domain-containing protein [Streptomyces sp. NPDC059096]|uniref:zf-HC2 domain-containing protein n=1 Tax=Streptomyces sp. NPDC059096 TaxID=3346727 RepID=UPI0036A58CE0
MSVEHASPRLIHQYARGDILTATDEVWALESHLEGCGNCRERLAAAVAAETPELTSLLGAVRSGLDPLLDEVAPMPYRRWWTRLSVWLTPVLAPWLVMPLCLTLIALLLEAAAPDFGEVSPMLLLAPVLPLAGVAASWSRWLDPAHELTAATPRAGLHLLLRRTTCVLALLIPVLLVGGWAAGVAAAQWLLPALAFAAAALALGSAIGVNRAVVAMGTVWGAAILAPALITSRMPFVLQPERLGLWGLLLVLGVGVVIARRSLYSARGGPH